MVVGEVDPHFCVEGERRPRGVCPCRLVAVFVSTTIYLLIYSEFGGMYYGWFYRRRQNTGTVIGLCSPGNRPGARTIMVRYFHRGFRHPERSSRPFRRVRICDGSDGVSCSEYATGFYNFSASYGGYWNGLRIIYWGDGALRRRLCLEQQGFTSGDRLWRELLCCLHSAFKCWTEQFVNGNVVLASFLPHSWTGWRCRV